MQVYQLAAHGALNPNIGISGFKTIHSKTVYKDREEAARNQNAFEVKCCKPIDAKDIGYLDPNFVSIKILTLEVV